MIVDILVLPIKLMNAHNLARNVRFLKNKTILHRYFSQKSGKGTKCKNLKMLTQLQEIKKILIARFDQINKIGLRPLQLTIRLFL